MFCGDAFMPDDSRCQYLASTIVGEVGRSLAGQELERATGLEPATLSLGS
jgi:hypothetical protein